MMIKNKIFRLFSMALIGVSLASCQDDEILVPDSDGVESLLDDYENGLSINFTITLDNMGGDDLGENPMAAIENYIDPEKFRVLFFDYKDRFLFESKSRRIRRIDSKNNFNEWLVSVPFYSTGNDVSYDWKWDDIRDSLVNHKFKVAILANRPTIECYPDLTKVGNAAKNFDNSGPHWERKDMGVKTVFDIHHSQWDPIYTDKGNRASGTLEGYYEFIMGTDPTKSSYNDRLMMSSTSCWVDHGPTLTDDGVKDSFGKRQWIMPTQSYPIPMYGIQEFEPLTDWVKGTPFNLSDPSHGGNDPAYEYRSVAMLRSVVKLELWIPTDYGQPTYVGMKYPNIYARCEPMDVWTPTDKIWKENHADSCEWRNIMKYGAMCRKNDPAGTAASSGQTESNASDKASFEAYRKRISWLYGAWLDKDYDGKPRWSFGKYGTSNVGIDNVDDLPYPRVFNPLTQRNAGVRCGTASNLTSQYTDKSYYRYVVYTGERNVNDPSDLFNMDTGKDGGGGKAPTISWVFNTGKNTTYYYNLPIGPSCASNVSGGTVSSGVEPGNDLTYEYQKKVWASPKDQSVIPWPLVRNHVYRIVLGKTGTKDPTGRSGEVRVTTSFQTFATKDINFKKKEKK